MDSRQRLIRRLADGRFHSGEALAGELGVSRAAVWKSLRTLSSELAVPLHAVRGRGYRLQRPLELIEREALLAAIDPGTQPLVAGLHLLDRVDSTNAWLTARAREGAPSGTLCLAEQQTAGRGRRGRAWASPYGSNVYLSVLWRYPLGPADLSGLSLVAGMAVLEALGDVGARGPGLKWPNDVLFQGRKLAGLLVEMFGESGGPTQVVVGVGVNTFLPDDVGAAIDQPWTDLARVPGAEEVSRNRLAGRLVDRLTRALETYAREGPGAYLARWHRHDLYYGRPVALHQGERVVQGRHAGIDGSGALLLEVDGRLQAFHAGEVSLRADPGGAPP